MKIISQTVTIPFVSEVILTNSGSNDQNTAWIILYFK